MMMMTTSATGTIDIFYQLLGERLLQHTDDGSTKVTNYMATNELEGKTVALYFS